MKARYGLQVLTLVSALCSPRHFVLLIPRASEEPQRIRLDQRSSWQHLRAHQHLTARHRKPCTSTDEANSSAEREQLDQHGANQPRQRGEMFISGTKLTELHGSCSPRQDFFPTAQLRFASSLGATSGPQSTARLLSAFCSPYSNKKFVPLTASLAANPNLYLHPS